MSETERRPRILFLQPSGWIPPIAATATEPKKAGRQDAALAQQRREEYFTAFSRAGWLAECWNDREDAVEMARRHEATVVIVPSHRHEESTATKLRALTPTPKILVALHSWDLKSCDNIMKYTGADNWFPYLEKGTVALAAEIWLKGGPTPEQQAMFNQMLPPPPPEPKSKAKRPPKA